MLKAILHTLRLAGFTLGLLTLLTLFHLVTTGLPSGITRKITARAQAAGLSLQMDSIRLSLHRGWVLKNVRLYSPSPDDLNPLFQTKKLYLFLWPGSLHAPAKPGWHATLHAKNSTVSLGRPWESALDEDSPFSKIGRMNASFHIQPKQFLMENSDLRWGGVRIRIAGRVDSSKPSSGAPPFPDFGARAAKIANGLADLQFENEPEIDILFNVNSSAPEENTLGATCYATGMQWKDRTYDRLSASVTCNRRQIAVPSLQIAQRSGHNLTASGSLDQKYKIAQLDLNNSLCADDLLALFPERVRDNFDRLGIRPLGAFDVNVSFGPAPPEQLLEQVRAEVRNAPMSRKDLTLDPFQFIISRDGNQLTVHEAEALVNGGPVTGTFEFDLSSFAWRSAVCGTTQPGPVGRLIGGGLEKFIGHFQFPNEPPTMQLNLSHDGTAGSLQMEGTMSATHFSCANVPIETLQTDITYSNRVLTLDPLIAANGRKKFEGDLQLDFAEKLGRFNVTTSFDPLSIARILAPEHPTLLEQFTFNGPVLAQGSGQVDYGEESNHAFSGSLQAEQVTSDLVQIDRLNTLFEGTGTQLSLTNTFIELYEGRAEGVAEFDLRRSDGSAPYHIQADVKQINLAQMLEHISTNDQTRTRGLLSGTLDITADAQADFWTTAKGRGQVEIKKGHLANLPLFRGLSRLIQSPFPGFKLFSISTLFAEFKLGGGKLKSNDLQLGGTLLSARAKGSYSPKTGFNVRLRAEPLGQTREGKKWYHLHLWSAEVLKKGTSPLFNLFDISLEGTLKDPQWRLLAVPKAFYGTKSSPEKPEQP